MQASQGKGHGEISRDLGISQEIGRRWWGCGFELSQWECPVEERLQDAPRPGSPPTFTLEPIGSLYRDLDKN